VRLRIGNRLGVEALEDRCVPAVTASIRFGVLSVTGSSTAPGLTITQTAAGAFAVEDGGNPVTITGSGTVRNVFVRLGSSDDTVLIDLGGETLAGSVTAWLGGGANDLTVQTGTIGRALTVLGGSGDEVVTLADDLEVNGPASVALNGGIDTLTVDATLASYLTTAGVDEVTLAGSVGRGATFVGDANGSLVDISGSVGGTVTFVGSFLGGWFGGGGGPNELALRDGAEVGGVLYKGAFLGSSVDTVTIEGGVTVNGSVYVATNGGDDVVTVGDALIEGKAAFLLGSGNDNLVFGATVGGGRGSALTVDAGFGDDEVEIADTAAINGNSAILLGFGNDSFVIGAALDLLGFTMRVNGGFGTDTRSDPLPTGVVAVGFP
jgi:hypothetical protein